MISNIKIYLVLFLLAVLPVLVIWAPFFLRMETIVGIPIAEGGMQSVIANYDGPLYIVIAKSLYNLDFIAANYSFPLPLEYYAAHFPLFPLLIKLFAIISGYTWGSLYASVSGSILAIYYFYKLSLKYTNSQKALWLTFIFAVFPARWLVVRSIASPEPFFLGSILASIYYFKNRSYWKAGFWGALAQLIKSPGILLFIALGLFVAFENLDKLRDSKQSLRDWLKHLNFKVYPILLIPLALLGVFMIYGYQFDNFFAYFNSGDNIHLFFPPFQIFNYSQPWVDTFWLEEIIFIYLIILVGLMKLIREKMYLESWFVGIFFATIIFVSHRDILRYSLPVMPFILLAFKEELQSKEAKFIVAFLLLPIYLFSLAFISSNVMPISDWTPFL